MTNCSIAGCPGHYRETSVIHAVRHQGSIVVIDHVPAEVCEVCGDVLFTPETVRHIEHLLVKRTASVKTVPLYEYA
jgi:YgiT-type zinc finger domain-containing protein